MIAATKVATQKKPRQGKPLDDGSQKTINDIGKCAGKCARLLDDLATLKGGQGDNHRRAMSALNDFYGAMKDYKTEGR